MERRKFTREFKLEAVKLIQERLVRLGVCHIPVIAGISTIRDRRVDYAPIV